MPTDTDILYASLLGSQIVKQLPRFEAVQNELMKRVLPSVGFLPNQQKDKVVGTQGLYNSRINQSDPKLSADQQFFPFYFVNEKGEKWLLPYEPVISIQGKNIITKRKVAKADGLIGSIKERWNQDDYEITITGVLFGSLESGSVQDCYPIEDFMMLKEYMTSKRDLEVFCEPLQLLGINRIVVEDFSFPFTKGENVQAYEIKAYSDFEYNLLIDLNE